jgi:hypothetical protein
MLVIAVSRGVVVSRVAALSAGRTSLIAMAIVSGTPAVTPSAGVLGALLLLLMLLMLLMLMSTLSVFWSHARSRVARK